MISIVLAEEDVVGLVLDVRSRPVVGPGLVTGLGLVAGPGLVVGPGLVAGPGLVDGPGLVVGLSDGLELGLTELCIVDSWADVDGLSEVGLGLGLATGVESELTEVVSGLGVVG